MIIDKKHRKCESLPNQDCPYGPHSCSRALGHLRRRGQSKRAGSSPSGAPAREPGRRTGRSRGTATVDGQVVVIMATGSCPRPGMRGSEGPQGQAPAPPCSQGHPSQPGQGQGSHRTRRIVTTKAPWTAGTCGPGHRVSSKPTSVPPRGLRALGLPPTPEDGRHSLDLSRRPAFQPPSPQPPVGEERSQAVHFSPFLCNLLSPLTPGTCALM